MNDNSNPRHNSSSNSNNDNNDDDCSELEKARGLTLRESHSTLFNTETSTIHSNDNLIQSVISRTSSPVPLNDHNSNINNTNLLQSSSSSPQPLKTENEKPLPITIESASVSNSNNINIQNNEGNNCNEIHKNWDSPPPNYEDLKINDDKEEKFPVETDHTIIRIDVTENDRHGAMLRTDKNIRMAFVRKVYAILTLQLLTTIGITVWFMVHGPVQDIIKDHQWIFFVAWMLAFLALVLLFWQRKKHPFNMILLVLFTLFLSLGIASVVFLYSSKVVLQSFIITFGVFVALELFTLQTKIDFSSWRPFLYAGLWVVIFSGLVGWLFPFDKYYYVFFSGVSALLFSAYIIYDTYMLFNRVSPEEYIMASVDLYLDIINLFIAMLALLTGAADK